jgi:uncharacterized protein (TIGR02284 family)
MDKNSEVISQLNELLAFNIDAKKGYRQAAEEIDVPALKGMLMCLAEQRENFRKSIREEIRYLGGEPEAVALDTGFIQQSLEQPELLMLLNNMELSLEECLAEEKRVLKLLKKQFTEGKDSSRNLIMGQLESVKLSLTDLRMLQADAGLTL